MRKTYLKYDLIYCSAFNKPLGDILGSLISCCLAYRVHSCIIENEDQIMCKDWWEDAHEK